MRNEPSSGVVTFIRLSGPDESSLPVIRACFSLSRYAFSVKSIGDPTRLPHPLTDHFDPFGASILIQSMSFSFSRSPQIAAGAGTGGFPLGESFESASLLTGRFVTRSGTASAAITPLRRGCTESNWLISEDARGKEFGIFTFDSNPPAGSPSHFTRTSDPGFAPGGSATDGVGN